MAIQKLPSGTHGVRTPPRLLSKLMMPVMMRVHRRQHDRFGGMDLLYLTTLGARSGERRTHPVARFPAAGGGWVVVASAGGTTQHPAWYHNLVAHPDQVEVEVDGSRHAVDVEQLEGEEREQAWATVVQTAPRFRGYTEKTDRPLPVLHLRPTA